MDDFLNCTLQTIAGGSRSTEGQVPNSQGTCSMCSRQILGILWIRLSTWHLLEGHREPRKQYLEPAHSSHLGHHQLLPRPLQCPPTNSLLSLLPH